MKTASWLAAISAAILAASPSLAVQGQIFRSPQAVAAALADGQPWSADTPDGKTLKFIFKKDGTGSIRGPMPVYLPFSWTIEDDAMCFSGKMGKKCLRFQEVPGGFQSWDGDKPDLKFSR